MLRIVHTGCGAIEGIAAPEPEITVFRGIPFAAPPVGDLRWRAPQPVAAWAGTLAAHDFAPPPVRSPHRETRTSSMTANGARTPPSRSTRTASI